MNYKSFLTELQNYYGPYPENSKLPNYIFTYLKRDIEEKRLPLLFRYVQYSHSHRFGAPGISDIEKSIYDAIRNNKGIDVHKNKNPETKIKEKELTKDELIEGEKLLKELGGLTGIFKKVI